MSNTDSFIDEVSEEVRKDKLFGYLRRYGWIAVVVVLVLVGGTAFSEFRKAQATAAAEETGNAILAALEIDDDTARAIAARVRRSAPFFNGRVMLSSFGSPETNARLGLHDADLRQGEAQ